MAVQVPFATCGVCGNDSHGYCPFCPSPATLHHKLGFVAGLAFMLSSLAPDERARMARVALHKLRRTGDGMDAELVRSMFEDYGMAIE